MKILHLMNSDAKFNIAIKNFYTNHISEHTHEICIVNGKEIDTLGDHSEQRVAVTYFAAKDFKSRCALLNKMEQYDFIFCHSIILHVTTMAYALLVKRKLLKKIIWIEYGADLYREYQKTVRDTVKNFIDISFVNRIKAAVMIFPPDEKVFRTRYGNRQKTFYAPYISGIKSPLLDLKYNKLSMVDKIKQDQPIVIQVGHSASPFLRHMDTLNHLKKFKDENIIVRLPMSYGPQDYAQEVISCAKSIFGDKVHSITEFVPLEDYYASLAEVDIGIWETHRQIALGNIKPLIYLNKKIYISSDCNMYAYFKEQGMDIHDAMTLNSISFSELTQDISDETGTQYRSQMYDICTAVGYWKRIYEWLEQD